MDRSMVKVRLDDSESEFEELSRSVTAAIDEVMGGNLFRLVSSDAWEPEVNVYEFPDAYSVCVNLAGMRHDAINVVLDGGVLSITGARSRPREPDRPDEPSVHVMEIDSGPFERRISVPNDVDPDSISAAYRNGFLWIRLGKQPETRTG